MGPHPHDVFYGWWVRRVMIVGGSGHASCVVDAAQAGSTLEVVAVVDDGAAGSAGGASTSTVLGVPVVGGTDAVAPWWSEGRIDGVVIGVGDNHTRLVVAERLARTVPGLAFVAVVHPTASVAASARIGDGAVVLAGASIGPQAAIDVHALLGAQANLDHDATMAAGSSLGPGALTGGTVSIGRATAVAMGAIVRHGLTIGDDSVLGAGAVLTRSLPDRVVAWGSPAEVMRTRQPGDRYL